MMVRPRITEPRRCWWLALAPVLLVAGGCSGSDPGPCADPMVLDQMHRDTHFAGAESAWATVEILEPADQGVRDGVRVCRATLIVRGEVRDVLQVLQTGYPFARAAAREAFERTSGLDTAGLVRAADYLAQRAGATDAEPAPMEIRGPLEYRLTREDRPFLLDWRLADDATAEAAGEAVGARLVQARAEEAAQRRAEARRRGFGSVAAMDAADARRRAANRALDEAEKARKLAADRLTIMKGDRERLARETRDAEQTLASDQAAAAQVADAAGDWEQRIRRGSFAAENSLASFDNTRLVTRSGVIGTPEDTVIADVVNYGSQPLSSADVHVVVWHPQQQRYYEDRSMYADFGGGGLEPGEHDEIRIGLNGRPGVGLAFTGSEFRAGDDRHAFVFVNALKNTDGKVIFQDRWQSPISERQAEADDRRMQQRDLGELRERLERMDRRIAEQENTLARAKQREAEAREALPRGQ
ncbi:hypothetical protein [Spectribacter hydrogenoxidans]|uniref:Uncharacterized protein n=1 Tax=Spectribacter hydrogenoxidans TaxID=3075608 RepID=A0ABU3BVZ9_9GAMM|nr:hypothetical protein [Salinisphaera sp. W335]MDT0633454.1 hypothetical protein [Salinisphaera sp. W335]